MKIELLVSTMNQRFDLEAILPAGLDVLVINQTSSEQSAAAENYRKRGEARGFRVLNFEERGLSRSRNRAIAAAIGDVCLIADDDILMKHDLVGVIRAAYERNFKAAAIVFQAEDELGAPIKKYHKQQFKHNRFSITSVSSIEISFRRDSILTSGISFDTRFGLGAQFVSGEENIFLLDLINHGEQVAFVPETIASHYGPTSGHNFELDEVVASKGAVVRRMYGRLSYPLAVAFAIKKSLQHNTNPIRMISLISRGWINSSR